MTTTEPTEPLRGGGSGRPRVVLGVAGGIAAYKSCELLRRLTESGHAVRVVPTRAALSFVGAATWEALSGEPVSTEVWADVPSVPHVALGRSADVVVVAPATADLMARAAAGLADDLLTSVLLTATCPVLLAPAMHTEMWQHPATVANVAMLRSRGVHVMEPASGRLTGSDSGPGRLPEPADIEAAVRALLAAPDPVAASGRAAAGVGEPGTAAGGSPARSLAGRHVVVSAGGTREHLDPVRFLGNRSSGRQGWALATTARELGAAVTLVAANVALAAPDGVDVVPVGSARELREAVLHAAKDADAVVMAAAVADFRPASYHDRKIKKGSAGEPASIELVANPDVLAELAASRAVPGQVVVGFAAETDDVLRHGREKLARKGCDLLVVNEVGDGVGFEVPVNAATILGADGEVTHVPLGPKEELARAVWRRVEALLSPR